METAGEGGAWGMALLASYMINKKDNQSLADYLQDEVYKGDTGYEVSPEKNDVDGFNIYIERYTKGLEIERAAVETLV